MQPIAVKVLYQARCSVTFWRITCVCVCVLLKFIVPTCNHLTPPPFKLWQHTATTVDSISSAVDCAFFNDLARFSAAVSPSCFISYRRRIYTLLSVRVPRLLSSLHCTCSFRCQPSSTSWRSTYVSSGRMEKLPTIYPLQRDVNKYFCPAARSVPLHTMRWEAFLNQLYFSVTELHVFRRRSSSLLECLLVICKDLGETMLAGNCKS